MMMEELEISTGNATLDAIALSSGGATSARLVEWGVFFGLAVLMTILRTFARTRKTGWNGLAWDDHLVWLALAAYAVLAVDGLSNDGMTDKHRWLLANDSASSEEYQLRVIGSKAQIVKWFLYALTLWLLKGSLLYFFSGRLTIPGAKSRAWVGAGFLVLTWAATSATVFASCRPFTKYWQIYPDPGIMCQPAISPISITVFLACNIITDVYLISIPIPVLLKARLRSSQKISLICLFSCNILITGVSLARAILMLKDPKINGDGMWDVRETFVALVTTNIPPIVPLFRSWIARCFGRPPVATTTAGISKIASVHDRNSTRQENPMINQEQTDHQIKGLERVASASTLRSMSVYSQDEWQPTQAGGYYYHNSMLDNNSFAEGQQSPDWFRREAMRRQIYPEATVQTRTRPRVHSLEVAWPFVTEHGI